MQPPHPSLPPVGGYYSAYPRMPSYPSLPGPFPPPYVGFHPSMHPPGSYMYPPATGMAGAPFMGAGGMLSPPPPVASPWNTAPSFPIPAASAMAPPAMPPFSPPPHFYQQHQAQLSQQYAAQFQPQQQQQTQSSGLLSPQGGTSPASLASLANLAPFLSRPHVMPAPQPMHATCLSCQQRIPMPQLTSSSTYHERVTCPHCHQSLVAADVVRAAEEEHFYGVLEPYTSHFDVHNAALAWLSQSKATRTGKLAVPRAFRWPKSTAGKGGYADAFVAMGLVLRRNDTASGHWHCWYVERGNATFQSMQAAITRRWKESPNYKDGMLIAADGEDSEEGDDEGATVAEEGGRKRQREDGGEESEYIERDFVSQAERHGISDAVDYNAKVVDIREQRREQVAVKNEKREGGSPARDAGEASKDAGSTTPRSVKSSTSADDTAHAAAPTATASATASPANGDERGNSSANGDSAPQPVSNSSATSPASPASTTNDFPTANQPSNTTLALSAPATLVSHSVASPMSTSSSTASTSSASSSPSSSSSDSSSSDSSPPTAQAHRLAPLQA